jgi:hypothetical protein
VKDADALVRILVMHRDKVCQRCGSSKSLAAAHLLPKGTYPRLRFELLNVIALCYRDHMEFAHKNPIEFMAWLEQKFPGRGELLRIMARTSAKIDMKELLIGLRIEVEQCQKTT